MPVSAWVVLRLGEDADATPQTIAREHNIPAACIEQGLQSSNSEAISPFRPTRRCGSRSWLRGVRLSTDWPAPVANVCRHSTRTGPRSSGSSSRCCCSGSPASWCLRAPHDARIAGSPDGVRPLEDLRNDDANAVGPQDRTRNKRRLPTPVDRALSPHDRIEAGADRRAHARHEQQRTSH
jgi:hypothetical protein